MVENWSARHQDTLHGMTTWIAEFINQEGTAEYNAFVQSLLNQQHSTRKNDPAPGDLCSELAKSQPFEGIVTWTFASGLGLSLEGWAFLAGLPEESSMLDIQLFLPSAFHT